MIQHLSSLTLIVGIVAAVAGFLSCAVLLGHVQHQRKHPTAIVATDANALYGWGALFFAGIGLLFCQFLMGKSALVPFPDDAALPSIITAPVQMWMLACIAGAAVTKAIRVHRRSTLLHELTDTVVERGMTAKFLHHAVVAVALLAALGVAGCNQIAARTQPEMAGEAETYKAVAPVYLGLIKQTTSLTDEQKARDVRTVRTWRARLGQELQGDTTYGGSNLQPDDAAISAISGIAGPTTQPGTGSSATPAGS